MPHPTNTTSAPASTSGTLAVRPAAIISSEPATATPSPPGSKGRGPFRSSVRPPADDRQGIGDHKRPHAQPRYRRLPMNLLSEEQWHHHIQREVHAHGRYHQHRRSRKPAALHHPPRAQPRIRPMRHRHPTWNCRAPAANEHRDDKWYDKHAAPPPRIHHHARHHRSRCRPQGDHPITDSEKRSQSMRGHHLQDSIHHERNKNTRAHRLNEAGRHKPTEDGRSPPAR